MIDALPHPSIPFTLITYLLMIGVLVVVHEGGHYLAGRLFGTKIDTFALGFGRELVGWNDSRGTRWRLNILPLGGYVKFAGDMNAASQPSPELMALPLSERAGLLMFKPLWQRAIVVAAGPLINFLFAILIFAGAYAINGRPYVEPVVGQLVAHGGAANAGMKPGDRVTAIGQVKVTRFDDVMAVMKRNSGQPIDVTVQRGAQVLLLHVQPVVMTLAGETHGRLGFAAGKIGMEPVSPLTALVEGTKTTGRVINMIGSALKEIVTGQRSIKDLGGPIKTAQITGQQAALGVAPFILFMAIFSVNLGFINLLPIPVLDGGHLFLYAVEAIRRQPLGPKVQEWAFTAGFAAIVSLMAILTWNDL